ncbi:MAG TPA: hypothetical protein VH988_05425 [Thermoanaerobaculia bacterium]|jgi:Ni/Fe-hydrogenase subunit HybB-like protein|nr:hypothetical protein [Thermoanaerobaculia bacterium]
MGGHYVPAWSEIVISMTLVAAGFVAFRLAVKLLPVYPATEGALTLIEPAVPAVPARSRLATAGGTV